MIKAMFANRKNMFAFKAFEQQARDAKLFSTNPILRKLSQRINTDQVDSWRYKLQSPNGMFRFKFAEKENAKTHGCSHFIEIDRHKHFSFIFLDTNESNSNEITT